MNIVHILYNMLCLHNHKSKESYSVFYLGLEFRGGGGGGGRGMYRIGGELHVCPPCATNTVSKGIIIA